MSSKANRRNNKATEKDQASTRSENMATASMPDALPEDLEKLRSILLTDMTQAVHSALKNELETALTPVNSTLEQVKSYYESHDERIRGVEDHLSEYSDMAEYFHEVLRADFFSGPLMLSCAHRIGAKPTRIISLSHISRLLYIY